jgi:hypothetical protein
MKKLIILSTIIALLTVSCNDEFLERDLLDSYSITSVFQTEKDIDFALNALYRGGLPGLNRGANTLESEYLFSLFTDDAIDRQGSAQRSGNLDFASSANVPNLEYKKRYTQIRDVNEFLERAPQAEPNFSDPDLFKRYMAEARFIRAYQYARLHFMFGEIVVQTVPTPPVFYPHRAEKLDIFNFLNDEFDAVAADLPDSYPADQKGRVTRVAALALKARHNLNAIGWHPDVAQLYKNAREACEQIYGGDYSLDQGVSGFQKLFNRTTEFGQNTSGAILTISYDRDLYQNGYANATLPKGAFAGSKKNNSNYTGFSSRLVEAFQMQANGLDVHDLSSGYDPANPWTGRDPRLDITVLKNGDIIPVKGGDGESDLYVFDAHPKKNPTVEINGVIIKSVKTDDVNKSSINETGYNFKKYINFDFLTPKEGDIQYHSIRYAEVILMYAEAVLGETGDISKASSLVDEVRARVGMPNVATSYGTPNAAEMLDIILDERRFEFAGEGAHRWFDIIRHRMAEDVFSDINVYGIPLGPNRKASASVDDGDLDFSTKHIAFVRSAFNPSNYYQWSIPQGAIANNPNLLETSKPLSEALYQNQ